MKYFFHFISIISDCFNYHLLLQDCFIGWSIGAQMGIHLIHQFPNVTERLFLLNPSTGRTLHSVMQPILLGPEFLGNFISRFTFGLRDFLYPVCISKVWPKLKYIVDTDIFHLIFIISAFLGGFPPEQPTYFTSYCEDIFISPFHTQHLLDLILALDERSPYLQTKFPLKTMIISGWPDIMTGVYHSDILAEITKKKNYIFTMGSHFLLIEWPDHIAKLLLQFLFDSAS